MGRFFFLAAFLGGLVVLTGCSHRPETVVHLTAREAASAWVVRDHTGARLCNLPCAVELDPNQTVVVEREGARATSSPTSFVVHQETLGAGTWSGAVRVRKEPSAGAIAIAAFSSALVSAGTTLGDSRREDRALTGIVLSGIGTAGLLASDAIPGKSREELWLDRMASGTPRD